MHSSLHNFLLKSIPYLLAIAGGAVLYWLTADKIQSPDLRDLVNNIAASLLAIPLVFLLYDYSNYLISRQLTRNQTDNIRDKIDNVLINVIVSLRQIMGMRGTLTLQSLNKMTNMSASEIASRIKLRPGDIQALQTYYRDLDELIYRNAGINVLSVVQLQALTTLMHNISHVINLHTFHRGRRDIARYTEKIIRFIADWVDSNAADSMHFQQLLAGGVADKNSGTSITSDGSKVGAQTGVQTSRRKK